MVLCYSFQAWLHLMHWGFLSLSAAEIHGGLQPGFLQSADFTLAIPPSSFFLPPMEEAKVLGLSFLTPAAPAQPGKFSDDFKENQKGPRQLFFVSSGSDCGKPGTEPSCHLELPLPGQELPPPGSVCKSAV